MGKIWGKYRENIGNIWRTYMDNMGKIKKNITKIWGKFGENGEKITNLSNYRCQLDYWRFAASKESRQEAI